MHNPSPAESFWPYTNVTQSYVVCDVLDSAASSPPRSNLSLPPQVACGPRTLTTGNWKRAPAIVLCLQVIIQVESWHRNEHWVWRLLHFWETRRGYKWCNSFIGCSGPFFVCVYMNIFQLFRIWSCIFALFSTFTHVCGGICLVKLTIIYKHHLHQNILEQNNIQWLLFYCRQLKKRYPTACYSSLWGVMRKMNHLMT